MTVRLVIASFVVVALLLHVSQATAQQQNQTIQLPVIRQFNVRNSVSVPDGGTIGLGGISRSSTGSISRGVPGTIGRPFANRVGGRLTSNGHASVSVWVLPTKEEINAAILAGAKTLPRESTVPYYKQVWDRQGQSTNQFPPLEQLRPPEPKLSGETIEPAASAAEPDGIFLGLP